MAHVRFHAALEPLMEPITGLRPNPANPNNGDVDAIIDSLLASGCYRPIIAEPDGTILAGHHLYAALTELGCLMVPVIHVDNGTEGRRILLGDNRIAALARIDDTLLLDLLETIMAEPDIGLRGTGYDEAYVESLAAQQASDYEHGLHLHLREQLTHTITCPNCGHSWVRGGDDG